MVLKDQVTDVRSDDEAEEEMGGLERVEGGKEDGTVNGGEKGMNGHKATQKRVEAPNGNALKGTAPDEPSFAEAVEGKKEK